MIGSVIGRARRGGLVGREAELRAVGALLGCSRLITLTGPPGVGKTRLARELAERHTDPAVFVDLAAIAAPRHVDGALAVALSVRETPGTSLLASVIASLCRRPLLLVLDNCEHLLARCRALAEALLEHCPDLTVLATSREPLAMAFDRAWAVAPLEVPAIGESEPEALLDYSAVRLFVDRAAAVQPTFELSSYIAAAVGEICRRLDGIPLAIELAAARVEALTAAEIARRLDDRFGLLTEGGGILPRHRTLQGALDWSHDLLSNGERVLLRRLSAFLGGFDVSALQAVCADGVLEAGEVPDLLDALVAKSLVAPVEGAGPARCRLLETVRAYASDRLVEAGEARWVRDAHAQFFVGLAEVAEPRLSGPDQELWFERLDAERDNLRAAFEWSLSQGDGESALRMAGALVLFWRVRCRFSEGRGRLQAALAVGAREAPRLRAKALWGAGFMVMMEGDGPGGPPLLEESLRLFRELGDATGCARAALILGNALQCSDRARALSLLAESAALAREADDPWCQAHALGIAGMDYAHHGDLPLARALLEECLEVAGEARDDQGLRIGLIGLGQVALHQGEYGAAQALLDDALSVARNLDEDYSQAEALRYLAWLALERGENDRSRDLLEQSEAVLPEIAPPDAVGLTSVLLARVDHATGDLSSARGRFERLLAADGPARSALAIIWLADLALEEGDHAEGRRLLGELLAHARRLEHKEYIANAVHRLALLARHAGDTRQAVQHHQEAMALQRQIGAAPGIAASLEALAGLAAAAGLHGDAARLLGATSALRRERGYVRSRWDARRYGADLALASAALSAGDFARAFDGGAELSLEDCIALAHQLQGRLGHPTGGWASLTDRELEVVELAAQGLTNPEIAARLVVTRATVKQHLWHAFSKLGVTRRGELIQARERASRNGGTDSRGRVPPPRDDRAR